MKSINFAVYVLFWHTLCLSVTYQLPAITPSGKFISLMDAGFEAYS